MIDAYAAKAESNAWITSTKCKSRKDLFRHTCASAGTVRFIALQVKPCKGHPCKDGPRPLNRRMPNAQPTDVSEHFSVAYAMKDESCVPTTAPCRG